MLVCNQMPSSHNCMKMHGTIMIINTATAEFGGNPHAAGKNMCGMCVTLLLRTHYTNGKSCGPAGSWSFSIP